MEVTITAPPEWLSAQRTFLAGFLTPPPGELDLPRFTLRVHTDDPRFRTIVNTIMRSPAIGTIEPVPGLLMHHARTDGDRACYVVATDQVDHQPGAYAVTVHGRDIELFLHSGTLREHRYPLRLIREIMLRTYEDAGGVIFHGAGVDLGGTAVMVCGPRNTGKTTLTGALLQIPGAALLSNDRVITCHGRHLTAVPLPVPTARGTIEASPHLRRAVRRRPCGENDLHHLPTEFGSTAKFSFTAEEFARAFGAHRTVRSQAGLIVLSRLSDATDPACVRRVPEAEAREVLVENCFTPRDEFWIQPWLIPRTRTDAHLREQAREAIDTLAARVPCIEIRGGVHNPTSSLTTLLHDATGDIR